MTYYDFDFNIESIAEFLYLRKMIILTLDVKLLKIIYLMVAK